MAMTTTLDPGSEFQPARGPGRRLAGGNHNPRRTDHDHRAHQAHQPPKLDDHLALDRAHDPRLEPAQVPRSNLAAEEPRLAPLVDTGFELHARVDRFGDRYWIARNSRTLEHLLVPGDCEPGELAALVEEAGAAAEGDRVMSPMRRVARLVRSQEVEWAGADRFVRWLYDHGLRVVFEPAVLVVAASLAAAGLLASAFRLAFGTEAFLAPVTPGLTAVAVLVLNTALLACHEIGHALVVVHHGGRVRSAGAKLYFGAPACFVDASDALLLPTGPRMAQAAAGVAVELVLLAPASLLLPVVPPGPLATVLAAFVAVNYALVFLNLAPFLELDGHHLLADALNIPDLRRRALSLVGGGLWVMVRDGRRVRPRHWAMAAFGAADVAFTIASLWLTVFFWRRLFAPTAGAAWEHGLAGKLVVLLLGGLAAAPVIWTVSERAIELARALRFRAQRRWRVRGAETLGRSGRFGDVPVAVLNEVAGLLHRRRAGAVATVDAGWSFADPARPGVEFAVDSATFVRLLQPHLRLQQTSVA